MSILNYPPQNLQGYGPAMRQPDVAPPLGEDDLIWIGEYPELELRPARPGQPRKRGLLRRTYAGVIYGLAPSQYLGPLQRLGWSVISAGDRQFPPITIIGDPARAGETTCDSILLLGFGEPILGTEGNGRRRFKIHIEIENRTGLIIDPSLNKANGKVTQEMVDAVRTK